MICVCVVVQCFGNALHACMNVQAKWLPAAIDVMAYQQKDTFYPDQEFL